MPPFVNLKGRRFGLLKVIEYAGRASWGTTQWRCLCKCGVTKPAIDYRQLVKKPNRWGKPTRSCGCLVRRKGKQHPRYKHGCNSIHEREWNSYVSMHQRCDNPRNPRYKDYGARGIRICKRWSGRNGFLNFLADMGRRGLGKTLDRIDVNDGYRPGNCRWATVKQQNSNRRHSGPLPAVRVGDLALSVIDHSLAADKPPGGW